MTTSELQDHLNKQLKQLSPDLLTVTIEFVDFLLKQQQHLASKTEVTPPDPESLGWSPNFFEKTFGAWEGEPLERGDQGTQVRTEKMFFGMFSGSNQSTEADFSAGEFSVVEIEKMED